MTENQPAQTLTAQSSMPQSLSRMTTSQIQNILTSAAVPSEHLLKRISVCLSAYFDPDNDPEIRAGVRKMYAKALGDLPAFAVLKAFSEWERTGTRRPTPADLRILAERELKPLGDELARRKAAEHEAKAEEERRQRDRVSPEAVARILAENGMTEENFAAVKRFPMAGSIEEAKARTEEVSAPTPHWTEKATEADLAQLRRARDENEIVQAARADMQRKR